MNKVHSDISDISSVPKNVLYSTTYYDKNGLVLRTISENILKGKDITSNIYEDITYQMLQTKQEHYKGPESIIIEKWFDYDHVGRLLATRNKINQQNTITSSAIKYNEAGEMISKYLHSNQTSGVLTFAQKVDYNYNIRSWLNRINDPDLINDNDFFGEQIFYNSTTGMGNLTPSSGLYNGNIVGIKWSTKTDVIRGYQFNYDELNRMIESNFASRSSLPRSSGRSL